MLAQLMSPTKGTEYGVRVDAGQMHRRHPVIRIVSGSVTRSFNCNYINR